MIDAAQIHQRLLVAVPLPEGLIHPADVAEAGVEEPGCRQPPRRRHEQNTGIDRVAERAVGMPGQTNIVGREDERLVNLADDQDIGIEQQYVALDIGGEAASRQDCTFSAIKPG